MKKALLSFAFLFFITTFSGIAQELTPIAYNDNLVSITDQLYEKGQKWGEQFNIVYKSKDFASLKPYRDSLENFIDTKINELNKMEDVSNSSELRTAMLSFLGFEKRMAEEAFKPMDQLSPTASAEEIQAAIDHISLLSDNETIELKKLGEAQQAYAASNDFTIAEPEENSQQ